MTFYDRDIEDAQNAYSRGEIDLETLEFEVELAEDCKKCEFCSHEQMCSTHYCRIVGM